MENPPKIKILIIEDDLHIAAGIELNLRLQGYRTFTAADGTEGLKRWREVGPDLIVLDMIMEPGMDGLETFKQMRQIAPSQKAIIASGYSESERVREMQWIGAGSYVKKPYTLEKIGLAVRKELDRNNNARSTDRIS